MNALGCTFVSLLFLFNYALGAKILAVFPFPAKSHNTLGISLLKGLAERGHEVVFLTPLSHKVPKDLNYTEILIEEVTKAWNANSSNILETYNSPFYNQLWLVLGLSKDVTHLTLNHPNFKKLLETHKHFDAVIVQQFHVDALKYLAWHYKAPLIIFNPYGSNGWVNHLTATPFPPSYAPEIFTPFSSEMTFYQRMHNAFINLSLKIYIHGFILPSQKQIYEENFPTAPPFEDVIYNTSLVLLMSDLSTHPAIPRVPNAVDIGGFHVKPAKDLPYDLKTYLDNQKNGVIYFSMGSNLKSTDMTADCRRIFLKVFSKLNESILWKWEADNLPGQPKNVKIEKWLPQQDLLGHPKIKLFITHGGLLSTTEAVFHGIPMLAIPVFADQYLNAESILSNKFGLRIPFSEITEDKLLNALMEMLQNPEFSLRAKEIQRIFHDKPMKPMDTANYWVEYVIRHHGARHLRVAGLKLPWFKYFLIDIFVFFVLVLVILKYIIKTIFNSLKQKDKEKKL